MTDPIVLLFGGDLRSVCALRWFHRQGRPVIALIINAGQTFDFEVAKQRAAVAGATAVEVIDVRERLVAHFGYTSLWGGALALQGDSVWPFLRHAVVAEAHVNFAQKVDKAQIAHTAFWADGEQACLELAYKALAPNLCVLAPLVEAAFSAQFREPRDYVNYAKNEGLLCSSETEEAIHFQETVLGITSWGRHISRDGVVPASSYRLTVAPEAAPREGTIITVEFSDGKPSSLLDADKKSLTPQDDPIAMMSVLNRLGGQHGIGRTDRICTRWEGPNPRVLFEAPGLAILDAARTDLELVILSPEVRKLRDVLAPYMREIITSGRWFTREMQFLEAALNVARDDLSGSVTLRLLCGNAYVISRATSHAEPKMTRLPPGLASLLTTMRFLQRTSA